MTERRWENVWAEIVSKAAEHMSAGRPVVTLGREVPNQITITTPPCTTTSSTSPSP